MEDLDVLGSGEWGVKILAHTPQAPMRYLSLTAPLCIAEKILIHEGFQSHVQLR